MKAVFFDLYGTLLDIRTEERESDTWLRFAAWMTNHGMQAQPEALRREFEFGVRVLNSVPSVYAYPEPDILPVFASMCASRGRQTAPEMTAQCALAFRRASTRMLKLYANSIPTLEYLRSKGIMTVLLSNAQRCFTMPELEMTGLLPLLDRVFLSSDEGVRKPDPAFFRMAMDELGLTPSECIMVGNDGASDIAGAKEAGLEAVYLRTDLSPDEPLPECRWVFPDGDVGHVRNILEREKISRIKA